MALAACAPLLGSIPTASGSLGQRMPCMARPGPHVRLRTLRPCDRALPADLVSESEDSVCPARASQGSMTKNMISEVIYTMKSCMISCMYCMIMTMLL
jgi:hypothetical protein